MESAFFKGWFQTYPDSAYAWQICRRNWMGKQKKMTVVVSGQGKNFKLSVRPRWSNIDGNGWSVGAEILNPPWGWTDFIMQYEPKLQDDVWATVSLWGSQMFYENERFLRKRAHSSSVTINGLVLQDVWLFVEVLHSHTNCRSALIFSMVRGAEPS